MRAKSASGAPRPSHAWRPRAVSWRIFLLAAAMAGLAACGVHHSETTVPVPSQPVAGASEAGVDGSRLAMSEVSIDAPKAGDVLGGMVRNLQGLYGKSRPVMSNVFHAGADLAPLVRNALAPLVVMSPDSPYRMRVEVATRLAKSRPTGFWGFAAQASCRTALSVTVLEGAATVLDKRYAGLSVDEYSLLVSDFPSPELAVELIQSSLAKAVRKMTTDPALRELRGAGPQT